MSAAHTLGSAFRKLGSVLNVREVRAEDEARAPRRADAAAFAARADAIAAEATAVEQSLRP